MKEFYRTGIKYLCIQYTCKVYIKADLLTSKQNIVTNNFVELFIPSKFRSFEAYLIITKETFSLIGISFWF